MWVSKVLDHFFVQGLGLWTPSKGHGLQMKLILLQGYINIRCRGQVEYVLAARFWIWTSSPFLNRFWFSLHIWKGLWKHFKSIPMRCWYCNIWLRNLGNGVKKCAKSDYIGTEARFQTSMSSPFLNRYWFSLHIRKGHWKHFKSIPMRCWYCNIWLRNL